MKAQITVVLAVWVALGVGASARAATSTFDSDTEGWKVVEFYFSDGTPNYGPDNYTQILNGPVDPTWNPTGGAPAGHIYFTEPGDFGQCFYFQAPSAYLGTRISQMMSTV